MKIKCAQLLLLLFLLASCEWIEQKRSSTNTNEIAVDTLANEQADPINHLSLVYEDAMMREVRINRLHHDRAWSQQPRSRTAHSVSCIVVESADPEDGTVCVGSSFHMSEWRSFGMRTFAGLCTHDLRLTDQGLKIVQKRVDLIDSEGVFEPIEVFI